MERFENYLDSFGLGSRMRRLFGLDFGSNRLKFLFGTDWKGLKIVRNESDSFILDIGLRRNESLFRWVSDIIGFIWFDVGFIWIGSHGLKRTERKASDSFWLNLELTHGTKGLKRIENCLLIRSEWHCVVRMRIPELFGNIWIGSEWISIWNFRQDLKKNFKLFRGKILKIQIFITSQKIILYQNGKAGTHLFPLKNNIFHCIFG